MKLSNKFFCIAYIIVLLTAGLSGILVINSSKNALVDSKTIQVNTVTQYATDSFRSFAEISMGEILEVQLSSFVGQIKNLYGNSIMDVNIVPADKADQDYLELDTDEGFSRFIHNDNVSVMESVCRIDIDKNPYFIVVHSDFTEIDNHYKHLWSVYSVVIFFFSLLSGVLLYILAKKVTRPIYNLSKVANNIANGNYGETIEMKSKDMEILELSNNFNCMSLTIKEKIKEIEGELSKRDMFVSNFTHEMKTPMTSIIGYSQMLDSYMLNEEERRQAISSIYRESTRLEKMAMQLLDLYIYKNEKIELERVSLKDIGTQLLSTLSFLEEKYNVRIIIELHNCIVLANRNLLLSVLYNLADNALKASSPQNEVKIYSSVSGDAIKFYVKDHGKGIAAENMKYITDPFYREDKARSRELGGAGLGLSLCQRIAELHNTKLIFESEKDRGTIVSFELKMEVKE